MSLLLAALSAAQAPRRSKEIEIPITVVGDATVAPVESAYNGYAFRPPELVVVSVPFARSQTPPDTPLCVVDDQGRPLPTEARVLATWPDGTIRWAQLRFESHRHEQKWAAEGYREAVANGRLHLPWQYRVRIGQEPPEASSRVNVKDEGGKITIDNGRIVLEVDRNHAGAGFARVWVKGRSEPAAGALDLVMESGSGTFQASSADPPRVHIEEAGALRAVVRLAGTLNDQYEWSTRLTIHAAEPAVRGEHLIRGRGDRELDELREIALTYTSGLGDTFTARSGGAVTEFSHVLNQGDQVRLYQEAPHGSAGRDLFYELVVTNQDHRSTIGRGGKAAGWLYGRAEDLIVGIAIEDFAEMSPKALAIAAGGEVRAELWPRERDLQLSRARAVTHNVLYAFHAPSSNETGTKKWEQAYTAQRHDLPYRAWVRPAVAVVDPEYACGTKAFGPFVAAVSSPLPEFEQTVGQNLDALLNRYFDRWASYGMLHYGDYAAPWPGDNGGNPSQPHWRNHEWEFVHALSNAFLRRGDPKAYRLIEDAARHYMDIDVHQTRPVNFYHGYGDRTEMHREYRGPHAGHFVTMGLVDSYLLTGNTRALETAKRLCDRLVQAVANRGPAYEEMLEKTKQSELRQIAWPLLSLVHLYDVTLEQRYLDAASVMFSDIESMPEIWDAGGSWLDALLLAAVEDYHRITGSASARRFFLKRTDWLLESFYSPERRTFRARENGPRYLYGDQVSSGPELVMHASALAYAYTLTKDRYYLEVAWQLLDEGMKFSPERSSFSAHPSASGAYQTGVTRSDGKFFAMINFYANRIPTAFAGLEPEDIVSIKSAKPERRRSRHAQ